MIRRSKLTFAALAAATALALFAAAPADAAGKSLAWKDAASDATPVGSTAGPVSNGALDILGASVRSDGSNVTWTLSFKDLSATTVGGTGVWYAFVFTYGTGKFTLRVNQDRVSGNTFQMQQDSGQSQVGTVSCPKCGAKVNAKENTVTITTPFASLANGVRAGAGKDPGPLAPGKTITALRAAAGNMLGSPLTPLLWFGAWDTSDAPDPAEFTF